MSTPKQLDLRWLTEAERDAKVTRAIAEMSGWTNIDNYWGREPIPFTRQFLGGTDDGLAEGEDTLGHQIKPIPPYATSADAVLPLLEKFPKWLCEDYAASGLLRFSVQIWSASNHPAKPPGFHANAPTFPIAACFAILRAKGVEVLT